MVRRKIIVFLFYSVLFSSIQAVRIELKVRDLQKIGDKKYAATQNETFPINVVVYGDGSDTGKIEVDGLGEFVVSGRSKSTSISIINGQQSIRSEHSFDLVPTEEGEFKIGPAFVEHEGKKISSGSVVVSVKKGQSGKKVASSLPARYSSRQNRDYGGYVGDYELFCKLEADKQKVVVGEPVVLSINIFARGNILQLSMDPPKFNGFLSKKIGPVKKLRQQMEDKLFDVYQENYLLYPLSPGRKEIKPVCADFSVPTSRSRSPFLDDSFFSGFFASATKRKQAFSNDLILQVDSLPKYSGNVDAVGSFTKFYAHVDQNDVKVNEPIVLYLDIDGEGNLEQIAAPKLELPQNFKFYESKFSVRQDPEQNYKRGSKHFEYILQVGRSGKYTIPEQKFTFFDMYSRIYKTLKTDPIIVTINQDPDQKKSTQTVYLPSDGIDDFESDQEPEQQFEKDISFIEEDELFHKKEYAHIPWWLFILLCLLPFLFLNSSAINCIREKFLYKFSKRYTTKKMVLGFERQLGFISKNRSTSDLYNFFLEFFASKFSVDISLVTQNFISNKLRQDRWEEEKIREFLDYLNECASFHFASKFDKENGDNLLRKAKYWFLLLNK